MKHRINSLAWIIAFGVILVALPGYAQTVLLEESFKDASAPEWVFVAGQGVGAGLTADDTYMSPETADVAGDGWLRLTKDLMNQASFAYYTNTISTTEGLVITFDFVIWTTEGRDAADGFVLALFEPTDTPSAGGYGGSLGYAQRSGIDGLKNAVVGFGFDAFGNFSDPGEGREGGPGRRRNSIAIRGPVGNSRREGYAYIMGTGSLDALFSRDKQTRDDVVTHSVRIVISPDKTVSVAWTDKDGHWEKLVWDDCNLPCPETLMIGFTAGTGGSRANQEVRNLKVATYAGSYNVWDGGSMVNASWETADNWMGNTLPVFTNTTDLRFSANDAVQLSNYLGGDRTVRGLMFTTNTVGDVTIRTTTTATGTDAANLTFDADEDGAMISVRGETSSDIVIGEGAGHINLASHLLVSHLGAGELTLGRPVTGSGGITKSGSGTLVLSENNTYGGATTLLAGTLALEPGGTLGATTTDLFVW